MPWIQQNDLLGHPNTKLFISHCGVNSLIEAVYHAVPVLAFPFTLDQPFNARVVVNHGYGLRMDFKTFTEEELANAASTIIADPSFKDRLTRASDLLKHKPVSPSKKISFWIEHVVKYGDKHLRTSAFELTHAQFFMLDIYAFVTTVLMIVFITVFCCCRLCYKLVCRRCRNGHKIKED